VISASVPAVTVRWFTRVLFISHVLQITSISSFVMCVEKQTNGSEDSSSWSVMPAAAGMSLESFSTARFTRIILLDKKGSCRREATWHVVDNLHKANS